MNKAEVDYKKKMKLHQKLGAKQFKKFVLKAEKLRWKITKKFFPKSLERIDKRYQDELAKQLKKATSEEEKTEIKKLYQQQILITHREYNLEENRNYHMRFSNPTEIISYLKYNKAVHKSALTRNLVLAIVASSFIVIGVGTGIAASFIAVQTICAIKNWQCINLQDYNICRFELHKKALEEKQRRTREQNDRKYYAANKVIEQALDTTKEKSTIPSPEEIISSITSIEQCQQMKEMLLSMRTTNNNKIGSEIAKGVK